MVINANKFDVTMFDTVPLIEKKRKSDRSYLDIICAFDIEATRLPDIEQAFMYIWQFQVGSDLTIIGRTWDEYLDMIEKIREHIGDLSWLVVYVHNLSYEFSFLKGIYDFDPDEVFCTDSRKVLKCQMYECIEYRCSYYLTNMSLDKFLKKYDVANKKTTYNYDKVRYPWTPLSQEELEYCINDVKGLVQALKKQMASDGDDLRSIPMTATGYVRRDARRAMNGFNYMELHDAMPNKEVYKLLRECFRGGDTLSNRWNTDVVIENISSADITSSYPASMLMDRFPRKFYQEDVSKFDQMYKVRSHALLFRIALYNINIRDPAEGHLYLSRDKCRSIINGTFVNGRILCADYLETTLTDVDFEIINRRYTYSKKIIGCLYSSIYKPLPSKFREVIRKYYQVKTELKGSDEGSDEYYYYMKNKEKLNSSYGMTVQDIGRDEIKFINGEFLQQDEPLDDLLARNNKKNFLLYQWGVWVAAWSRKRLADGIDVVTKNGKEPMNFIYSDTDSIKYVGNVNFAEYNAKIEEEAKYAEAYAADQHGEVHFMGTYENEQDYRKPNRFKTLGAKKYVLQDDQGKLHITIAGVNKKAGAAELGKIENFKEGFIFQKAGGTESVFNDNIDMHLRIDGHDLRITDNVVIRPSTYTLGITAEYRAILDGLIDIRYSDVDIPGLYKVKN